MLLSLEFKLFAIRHPQQRRRLATLHSLICIRTCIPELSQLIPQLTRKDPEEQLLNTLAIGGILDGLAISHLFDPEIFDPTPGRPLHKTLPPRNPRNVKRRAGKYRSPRGNDGIRNTKVPLKSPGNPSLPIRGVLKSESIQSLLPNSLLCVA